MELPTNLNTPPPELKMANTREEMEQLVQEGLKRLNLVRNQEAFYLPRDWFDVEEWEQAV
jgi:hypothetical protein